jgi:hypothetical protein
MKPALILLCAILLTIATIALPSSFHSQSPDSSPAGLVCNSSPRTCLDYTLNIYLKALLVHKPEALPVAENIRFTENGVVRRLGEGLWQTITKFNVAAGGTKQEYIDLPQGIAGLHMVAMEGTTSAVFILRIKVADRKITEAETHVLRSNADGSRLDLSGLNGFSGPMNIVPKQSQLNSRDELARISAQYLEAQKSGNFNAAVSVLAGDAYRVENGRATEGLRTQPIRPAKGFTYRIDAIDEDFGLVWVREDFSGRLAWEGIKIYDGQIHAIEGVTGI